MARAFAVNLRLACSYEPSISEVCRRVGINRSQFNRYLTDKARPSAFILNRLCDHFGVEATEFFAPPAQFAKIISIKRRAVQPRPVYGDMLDRFLGTSLPAMRGYAGFYHVYYNSMSFPGRVLRGVAHVFEQGGNVYVRRIERFPSDVVSGDSFKCRYAGVALFLEDRIFVTEAETLTGNEITQTIIYPSRRNRLGRLTGLITGVSAGNQRRIACSRVVYDWLGTRIDIRSALRACGFFRPGEGNVPGDIRAMIETSIEPGVALFYPPES